MFHRKRGASQEKHKPPMAWQCHRRPWRSAWPIDHRTHPPEGATVTDHRVDVDVDVDTGAARFLVEGHGAFGPKKF